MSISSMMASKGLPRGVATMTLRALDRFALPEPLDDATAIEPRTRAPSLQLVALSTLALEPISNPNNPSLEQFANRFVQRISVPDEQQALENTRLKKLLYIYLITKGRCDRNLQKAISGTTTGIPPLDADKLLNVVAKATHIQALLFLGFDCNIRDEAHRTPLYNAATRNDVKAIDAFLKAGASVDLITVLSAYNKSSISFSKLKQAYLNQCIPSIVLAITLLVCYSFLGCEDIRDPCCFYSSPYYTRPCPRYASHSVKPDNEQLPGFGLIQYNTREKFRLGVTFSPLLGEEIYKDCLEQSTLSLFKKTPTFEECFLREGTGVTWFTSTEVLIYITAFLSLIACFFQVAKYRFIKN